MSAETLQDFLKLIVCFLEPESGGEEPDIMSATSEMMVTLNDVEEKSGNINHLQALPLTAQAIRHILLHVMFPDNECDCSNALKTYLARESHPASFKRVLLGISEDGKRTDGELNSSQAALVEAVSERDVLLNMYLYSGFKFAPVILETCAFLLRRLDQKQQQQQANPAALPRWLKFVPEMLNWCSGILNTYLQQKDGSVQFVEQDMDAMEGTQNPGEEKNAMTAGGRGDGGGVADEDEEPMLNAGLDTNVVATPDVICRLWFQLISRQLAPVTEFLLERLTGIAASLDEKSRLDVQNLLLRVASLGSVAMSGCVTALQFEGSELRRLVDAIRTRRGGNKSNAAEMRARRAEQEAFKYSVPLFVPGRENEDEPSKLELEAKLGHVILGSLNAVLELDAGSAGAGSDAPKAPLDVNVLIWLLQRRSTEEALQRLILGSTPGGGGDEDEGDDDALVAGQFLTSTQRMERRLKKEEQKKALGEAMLLWSEDDEEEYDDETGELVNKAAKDYELQQLLASEVVPFQPIGVMVLFSAFLKKQLSSTRLNTLASMVLSGGPTSKASSPPEASFVMLDRAGLSLEGVFDALVPILRISLRHDALACKEHALCLIHLFAEALPKYAIHLQGEEGEDGAVGKKPHEGAREGAAAGGDDEDEGSAKIGGRKKIRCITRRYQELFFLAQDIVNIMATCPSLEHRTFASEILRCFLDLFSERTRLPMLRGLIELSPYSSVTTLLLLALKDEVLLDYQLLRDRTSRRVTAPGRVATKGVALSNAISSFHSEVLSLSTVEFVCGALSQWSTQVKAHSEPLVTGANVLRTLIFSDLGFQRFCTQLLTSDEGENNDFKAVSHGFLFAHLNSEGSKIIKAEALAAGERQRSKRKRRAGGDESFSNSESAELRRAEAQVEATFVLTDLVTTVLDAETLETNIKAAEEAKSKGTLGLNTNPKAPTAGGGDKKMEMSALTAGDFTPMMRFSIEMAVDGLRGCFV